MLRFPRASASLALVVCGLVTGGPASAQTWKDVLGGLTGPTPTPTAEPAATPPAQAVDPATAGFALKELLLVAAETAVAQGSRVDGFAADPELRVPLPGTLGSATDTLRRFGLDREVDALTLALNRAAEDASGQALPVLRDAVRDLAFDDPQATVAGDGHPATDNLRTRSEADLVAGLRPLVAAAVEKAGATRAFDELRRRGGGLVDQSGVGAGDLVPHVTAHTVDGLLTLMAAAENSIRSDPAARTTPLLAEVFGGAPAAAATAPPATPTAAAEPSDADAHSALRQALILGARHAVEQASVKDGFLGNPAIRIPLPKGVASLGRTLRDLGMGQVVDEFETSLNRAAEKAAGEAKPILVDAVKSVTFTDAVAILQGGDTAATDMLRTKTEGRLSEVFEPIISQKMQDTGVTRAYDQMMSRGGSLVALLDDGSQPDLPTYVTGKTLDGLFALVAEEEVKIRTDPAARTTELLRRIFGAFGH